MSKTTKRKHVTKEALTEYYIPEGEEEIVKVSQFYVNEGAFRNSCYDLEVNSFRPKSSSCSTNLKISHHRPAVMTRIKYH